MKSYRKIAIGAILIAVIVITIVRIVIYSSNERKIEEKIEDIKNNSVYLGEEYHFTASDINETNEKLHSNKRRYAFYNLDYIIYCIMNNSKVFKIQHLKN